MENGLTTPDMNQADVKRSLLNIGGQRILLVDSTKIGHNSFARVAEVDDIDILVTDQGITAEVITALSERDVQVHIAEPK